MKNIFIRPNKENLTSFVTIGGFLVFISFIDVLANTFLNLNFTGFLPNKLSYFAPLIIGTVGLYLIREDYEDLLLAANITKALDTRVELDGVIEGTRKNSLDPYAIMRTMYLQRRARLVANEESEDTSIYDIDIDVMLID